MKEIIAAAIVFGYTTAALASGPGVVSQVYSGGGANNPNDPRPCVFFQTTDSQQWYALPQSDGNFAAERDWLIAARLSGNVLTFGIGSAVAECSSLPRAYGLSF